MNVGFNFDDHDLVVSEDHPELELVLEELEPWICLNAARVIWTFLQPARDLAGRLEVTSFVRGSELNDLVGGKPMSDHMIGLAADFVPLDIDVEAFLALATSGSLEAAGCSWDKLNLYRSGAGSRGSFHVAHRPIDAGRPRMRTFVDWVELTT